MRTAQWGSAFVKLCVLITIVGCLVVVPALAAWTIYDQQLYGIRAVLVAVLGAVGLGSVVFLVMTMIKQTASRRFGRRM
jgi:predicted membrane-bound spermidine synthase